MVRLAPHKQFERQTRAFFRKLNKQHSNEVIKDKLEHLSSCIASEFTFNPPFVRVAPRSDAKHLTDYKAQFLKQYIWLLYNSSEGIIYYFYKPIVIAKSG
ncbi:hypothetical protein [Lacimicrobium alkaliphilum]|uniref:Uncharacterized protein n=1 Tax=Lacimicrobium alkaliphilum TaxID=1526571 RepID=A0ABQ1RKT6_9ALTE|nr:hypothetical protein [Lacimicrobium alkaliphilum]GGD73916.1 hypothetical protein GCM10011357_31200 [Lacimicrobium alkaliphilum]